MVGLAMPPADAQTPKERREPDYRALRAAQAFLQRLDPKYAVVESLLFGSWARGDQTADSDADLAVVLSGENGDRYGVCAEWAALEFDAMLETGVLVQALPIWESEWREPARFPNPALIENIRRDGVAL